MSVLPVLLQMHTVARHMSHGLSCVPAPAKPSPPKSSPGLLGPAPSPGLLLTRVADKGFVNSCRNMLACTPSVTSLFGGASNIVGGGSIGVGGDMCVTACSLLGQSIVDLGQGIVDLGQLQLGRSNC